MNAAADEATSDNAVEARLGKCLHRFEPPERKARGSRRLVEIVGVGGVLFVPVGVGLVEGTIGTVVAVLGGLVAVVAYFLSAKPKAKKGLIIEVHEGGIVASQGTASRELVWNEVVDISTKRMPMPTGQTSTALVLEVVAEPPLLIMVGGMFSDASRAGQLVQALSDVWIPVWCRRARVQLECEKPVRVGRVMIGCDGCMFEGKPLPWGAIRGVESGDATDKLITTDGIEIVDDPSGIEPFPSAAKRLAALASLPPSHPLLPAPRVADGPID